MAGEAEQVVCALCGSASAQPLPADPEAATHSPDLDLRPSGLARRQLASWVQHCPHCGYCYAALDELPDGVDLTAAAALVASDRYRATLTDARYPALANQLRAQALLQAATAAAAQAELAAVSLLYAAWACDDAAEQDASAMPRVQAEGLARGLRRAAAEGLRTALEAGRTPVIDAPTTWLVLADCYRRAEVYPSAHSATVRGLAACADPAAGAVLEALLRLEQHLIEEQETRAVNMAEAFEVEG